MKRSFSAFGFALLLSAPCIATFACGDDGETDAGSCDAAVEAIGSRFAECDIGASSGFEDYGGANGCTADNEAYLACAGDCVVDASCETLRGMGDGVMAYGECLQGCLNGGTGGSGAGGGGTGGGGEVDTTGQPPPRPTDAPDGDGAAPRVFAVTELFVGDRGFNGSESDDAWKSFGYDVDRLDTVADFDGLCSPQAGGNPSATFPDGDGGVDNAFGKLLVPIMQTIFASQGDLHDQVNEPIAGGDYTLLFDLEGLGPEVSYSSLDAAFVDGRDRSGTTWLVEPASVSGGQPVLRFTDGWLADDTWVSGTANAVLPVRVFGVILRIHQPRVTAVLDASHGGVSRGIISGVLDTEETVAAIRQVFARFDPSFCDSAATEGYLNQMRQTSDIMADGSQVSGTPCTGISIGLGFVATSVDLGGTAPADPPIEDPCEGF